MNYKGIAKTLIVHRETAQELSLTSIMNPVGFLITQSIGCLSFSFLCLEWTLFTNESKPHNFHFLNVVKNIFEANEIICKIPILIDRLRSPKGCSNVEE